MELSGALTAIFTVLCALSAAALVVVFSVWFIKSGQDKNPPYHKIVSETGDVIVYVFEWSRGSRSMSDKYAGKYQEYFFLNTVNGLKYVRSDKRKLKNLFFCLFFTVIFFVFLFPLISEMKFNFLYFISLFSVYIFALVTMFCIENTYLSIAKKHLKENGID